MTTTKPTGVCPVCNGTARRPVPDDTRRYIKYNERWGHWGIAGYDPDTDTLPCTNCGGQYMSMKPTGVVALRPDGTPCEHKYKTDDEKSRPTRGWHVSNCIHCGDRLEIDSGD